MSSHLRVVDGDGGAPPPVNESLVTVLEECLAKARAGEMTAFYGVGLGPDDTTIKASALADEHGCVVILGEMEVARIELAEAIVILRRSRL